MTTCASACGHQLPHGLCSRHGEPYQLPRGCGCPESAPHPLANGYLDAAPPVAGVLEEVAAERARQDAKWGDQSHHPDGTGGEHRQHMARMDRWRCQQAAAHGTVTWQHILQEEVSEAFAETDPVRLRTELLQVAAVASQWVEAIDRREGRSS